MTEKLTIKQLFWLSRLVDPVVDANCLIVFMVVEVFIAVIISGKRGGDEILECCNDSVIIIEVPLDYIGCPRLVGVKPSHGFCVKVWRSR